MKKTALLILTTVTICCCIKKAKMCCSPYEDFDIKWEMRKSVGGIAGTIIYQPGNGNILEFKSGRLFNQYENGNIFQSGTYDIKPTSEESKYSITFHTNVRDWSTNIIIKGDTLVLLKYEPCCDIPDNTYIRI